MRRITRKYYAAPIVHANSTTIATVTTGVLNGILRGVAVDCPNLDGTTTLTVTLSDADGNTLWTKAAIAENAKTSFVYDTAATPAPLQVPVAGPLTITCTASNAQSTDQNINVAPIMDSYM